MSTPGFLETILDYDTYAPHGYCLLWQPELVGIHVVSDLAIALAYYSIPPTMIYLVRKHRATLPFKWVFVMFAVFIFLCGTTHVLDIITLWYPIYFLQGIVKALTAGASLATAVLMFPLIPTLVDFLRPAQSPHPDRLAQS
jgi:hypothetical protein